MTAPRWPSSAEILEVCVLRQASDQPRTCAWCGRELSGRRTRWCSDRCEGDFLSNHWPQPGRAAAMARDGYACVRCGFVSWREARAARALEDRNPSGMVVWPAPTSFGDWAVALGLITIEEREDMSWDRDPSIDERIRQLPPAIEELIRAERAGWERLADEELARRPSWLGQRHELEVNHIQPVRGVRVAGCHHHLDNLETLCRPCHVQTTRKQILSTRAAGGTRSIACWEGDCSECWADDESCYCQHHATDPAEHARRLASLGPVQPSLEEVG